MAYELIGNLEDILELQQVTETFKKREFVVKIIDNNGYENLIKFQVTQKNCDLLDNFKLSDNIKVLFNVKGRKWEKEGKVNYFTNLEAFNIRKSDGVNATNDSASTPVDVEEAEDDIPF